MREERLNDMIKIITANIRVEGGLSNEENSTVDSNCGAHQGHGLEAIQEMIREWGFNCCDGETDDEK